MIVRKIHPVSSLHYIVLYICSVYIYTYSHKCDNERRLLRYTADDEYVCTMCVQVGESLLARKDLQHETQFKENMIGSVMPSFIAKQLMENETALPGSRAKRPSGCAACSCSCS